MHPLTKINDTLFCVEVPMEATNFGWLYGMFTYDIVDGGESKTKMISEVDDWMQSIGKNQRVELLGYCTDKEIPFEVEEFIEKVTCRYEVPQRAAGFLDVQCYKNYMVENQYANALPYHKENCKELSFRSLLLSKGLYWDNPLGKNKDVMIGHPFESVKVFEDRLDLWKYMEQQKITGKLVFLKLIK